MDTKICGKCKIEKDLTMFSKEKNGKIPWACKECKNKMYKEWEAKNPDKRKRLHQDFYNKKKDRMRWYFIEKKYGMSQEKYYQLLEEQNNGCKICGTTEAKHRSSNNLLVDHCHVTGKYRGLLCNRCNTSLGFVNDDIELLENMVKYLKEYKQ